MVTWNDQHMSVHLNIPKRDQSNIVSKANRVSLVNRLFSM